MIHKRSVCLFHLFSGERSAVAGIRGRQSSIQQLLSAFLKQFIIE